MATPRQELPAQETGLPTRAAAPAQTESLYYDVAVQEIARLFQAAADGTAIRIGNLQRIMAALVRDLTAADDLLLKALEPRETQLDRPRHMLNTAIFAVKIGQGLEAREEELPWLALAGGLHDIGMVIVPPRILSKPSALTAEERDLVRMHPEKGYRLLQGLGPEYEWLANVVIQHHEREDGSGYPRRLKGEEIHDFSKIIGVADTYEALTHPRPHRPQARFPLEAVKEIINTERQRFPSHVLKGFIRGLSTFPVGSLVRLNTGEIAQIVATNPAFPLRPVVEIVAATKKDGSVPARRVDLSTNTLLYVMGTAPNTERPGS
ncbi:MAG: HD-GYP domain-containing protein [candidate division NC10 bacterium]|nr:HD-GYP domain-containing protein [candidate division NC10 bacterium]